jgi:hypothetical protein
LVPKWQKVWYTGLASPTIKILSKG